MPYSIQYFPNFDIFLFVLSLKERGCTPTAPSPGPAHGILDLYIKDSIERDD